MYKLLMSFMVIWDVYRSFIPDDTTFTKYCLTWNPLSILRQYLVNFMGLMGIINTTVYKTEHGKLS